jgi:hypothetical protein
MSSSINPSTPLSPWTHRAPNRTSRSPRVAVQSPSRGAASIKSTTSPLAFPPHHPLAYPPVPLLHFKYHKISTMLPPALHRIATHPCQEGERCAPHHASHFPHRPHPRLGSPPTPAPARGVAFSPAPTDPASILQSNRTWRRRLLMTRKITKMREDKGEPPEERVRTRTPTSWTIGLPPCASLSRTANAGTPRDWRTK